MATTRFLLLLLFLVCAGAAQNGSSSLDDEIVRLRKELSQVAGQRNRAAADAVRDAQEFQSYQARTAARKQQLLDETDSIHQRIRSVRHTGDSLSAVVASVQSAKKQFALLQSGAREELKRGCDTFLRDLSAMPPLAAGTLKASLRFLQGELAGNAVDNGEALQRLDQILRDMHEATMSVQDQQGESPLPEITGSAKKIRIGTLLEACSDEKGTIAALWVGSDSSGTPRWKLLLKGAGAIAAAVDMRQGKAMPSIIDLPFEGSPKGGGAR